MDKKEAKKFGELAEQRAMEHLLLQGYLIRERNWQPEEGRRPEVDIIAEKDDQMVFIEVKARSGHGLDPMEAVDLKKQRRIIQAADIYLSSLQRDYRYRFDVICITGSPDDLQIEHVEDAFIPLIP